ncbi:MAG: dhaL [Microbacteriaceae bacterium]|nr:dhaL [Microbacteriaceae bacterium]
MNVMELRGLLDRTLLSMPAHSDELRALDAAIGDGDLGITVSAGSTAAREAMNALDDTADVRAVLQTLAQAFSTANPSTFAALVGGGLLAAAKTVGGKTSLDRDDTAVILDAVAARISERGKSKLGDKTVLDALIPSIQTLRTHAGTAPETLDAMVVTARQHVAATAALQSAKGRAAWVQERSIGQPDPGATAYLRFLEALRAGWAES